MSNQGLYSTDSSKISLLQDLKIKCVKKEVVILKCYTGIGARDTPNDVLKYFYQLGYFLGIKGFTLRSGAAKGADSYFEHGSDKADGSKEIYLPWGNFEGSNSNLIVSNIEAYNIAEKFHPYWHNLSAGAKKLQSRNSHQILGLDLKTPSDFVLCWTKNGKGQGGTGQALRIAEHYNIPIFDAGKYENVEEIKKELKLFLISNEIFSEKELSK